MDEWTQTTLTDRAAAMARTSADDPTLAGIVAHYVERNAKRNVRPEAIYSEAAAKHIALAYLRTKNPNSPAT